MANPIDLLATGTPEQLAQAIDACEHRFKAIDGMAVIYGSAGLFPVDGVYDTIHEKMAHCRKPIIPILPSVMNAESAIERFKQQGHVAFSDEVAVGEALVKVLNAPTPFANAAPPTGAPAQQLNALLPPTLEGFVPPQAAHLLLQTAGIAMVGERYLTAPTGLGEAVQELGFPLVAKVMGPLHKTDVGGVVTQLQSLPQLQSAFDKLMAIEGAQGVLLQPQLKGHELFVGVKSEPGYGHLIMFGLGGIYVEALRDVACVLAPATADEVADKLKKLRIYPLFKGLRGQTPIDEQAFCQLVTCVSDLLVACPQIDELDLNPVLATTHGLFCVDARLSVKKITPPD